MTPLELQLFEMRGEIRRLRQVKDEAIEQAEQWKRSFVDAEAERMRLEGELRDLRHAVELIERAHHDSDKEESNARRF